MGYLDPNAGLPLCGAGSLALELTESVCKRGIIFISSPFPTQPSETMGPRSVFCSRETDAQCDHSYHLVVMLIKTPCGSHLVARMEMLVMLVVL